MNGRWRPSKEVPLINRALALAALSAMCLIACSSSTTTPTNPAPTPTPTPAPAATPQAFSCPLATLPNHDISCPKLPPRLYEYVDRAIAQTVKDHPELFDLSVDLFDGNVQVPERGPYIKAVVKATHDQGVCAVEQFEEIAVKTSNDFNEQNNIWVSSGGFIRKGPGAYITTCFPASF
jgi:hypothetical protein